MPHNVLCNLLEMANDQLDSARPARTLQLSSLNFDRLFQEIFSTLYAEDADFDLEEQRWTLTCCCALMRENAVERIFLPFVGLAATGDRLRGRELPARTFADVIHRGEQLQITPQVRAFSRAQIRACCTTNMGPRKAMLSLPYPAG